MPCSKGRAPTESITYNKEDIWLTGERRSNYGKLWKIMENFLFLRKYRSRETARPCGGSIYANQIQDGKRMARKQNSNQIVQHTARILSRYQCARARGARAPAKYITYNTEDIWLTGERRSNYGRFFLPPKIPFS